MDQRLIVGRDLFTHPYSVEGYLLRIAWVTDLIECQQLDVPCVTTVVDQRV